ncbi:mesotocin receptor-like [Limulus polyphemus]|uniref:Mesotocin receptor-like n=1 Tax=Limulus polyphemus TaxID=6850 RepID=A0ABM1B6P6_LIMPO|nr:mesotocin receptor-like [Limulus polyphemus]
MIKQLETLNNDSLNELLLVDVNNTLLDQNFSNTVRHQQSLYDQPVIKSVRVTTLCVLAVLGFIGNLVVLFWLWNHRARKSRVLRLFLNLTIADVLVTVCATGPQLVWEYYGREWRAGDVVCRLVKFLQTFSICASNYLIVAIALDRYKAIRRPLSPPWKTFHLASWSWLLAGLTNFPCFFLFRQMDYQNQTVCRNVLYDAPAVFLKVYLTAVVVLVFIIPLLVISVCYTRIIQKISQKAEEIVCQTTFGNGARPDGFALQRLPNNCLSRAKQKTLRMTFVVITSFLLCSSPYCIVEMWRMYGNATYMSAMTYSILAALAVSNSSTNPFVFLFFHCSVGVRRPARILSRQLSNSPKFRLFTSKLRHQKEVSCPQQNDIFLDVKSRDTSMASSCFNNNTRYQLTRVQNRHRKAKGFMETQRL